jgi:hypothetical protein
MCFRSMFFPPGSIVELPLWRNDATLVFFAQSVAYIERLRVAHIGRLCLAHTERLWVAHIGRLCLAHIGRSWVVHTGRLYMAHTR